MLLPYGTDTYLRGCRCGRARMVIGFITTYAISGHRWFSPDSPVFSTNKTDSHDITKIVLEVALNSIILIHIFCFVYV
jgi:hypothetical protein